MYEWLHKELAAVNTPKFHIVDGPAAPDLRAAIEAAALPIPESYKAFVLVFGNARLYRRGDGHIVGVRAFPEESNARDGSPLRCIGHYEDARAYFYLRRSREVDHLCSVEMTPAWNSVADT